jgi:hypothetical protein
MRKTVRRIAGLKIANIFFLAVILYFKKVVHFVLFY